MLKIYLDSGIIPLYAENLANFVIISKFARTEITTCEELMRKIKILFPYVEAGFGHIMPMKAIEDKFREKYGEYVEIISSRFFTETGDKHLRAYQNMLARQVRTYNGHPLIGYLATYSCEFFGTALSSFASMKLISPFAYSAGVKHMRELSPDVVVSTHWVTNYYAEHQEKKPLTVMYCPDARYNKLFCYSCDLSMISMPYGYHIGLRKKRFNVQNLKLAPFLIRNEAFSVEEDKKQLRRSLGLPEDNFTVVLAEGGYGIGKMARISRLLAKEELPITVVALCGKNEKLYSHLKGLKVSKSVTLVPLSFTDKILEYEAASDLFCGKSGNIIAEATFFGVPAVITNFSTLIEQHIGDHYINAVGSAIKEFSPKKTVKLIKEFIQNPDKLSPYKQAAESYRENFGAERAADIVWEKITESFPSIALP